MILDLYDLAVHFYPFFLKFRSLNMLQVDGFVHLFVGRDMIQEQRRTENSHCW